MRSRTPFAVLCMTLFFVNSVHAQFVPGHIFVAQTDDERCIGAGRDRIWEIDPTTGEFTLFAQLFGNECGEMSGLTFTPDGTHLRASQFSPSRIVEFDSEGNFTTVLDESDGIFLPGGSNNIAYDAAGNFYVLNGFGAPIRRFPADGGPGTIFADREDGVVWSGAIAFAADGDLYYAGSFEDQVVRITPEGEGFVFDEYPFNVNVFTLTADGSGNVYVKVSRPTGTEILRYRTGNPNSQQVVVSAVPGSSMTVSPDNMHLFLAASGGTVYSVDLGDGTVGVVAQSSDYLPLFGAGIAVAPVRPGDLNKNGSIDLADFAVFQRCFQSLCPKVYEVQVAGSVVLRQCSPVQSGGDSGAGPECLAADLTGNGQVDLSDFSQFIAVLDGP